MDDLVRAREKIESDRNIIESLRRALTCAEAERDSLRAVVAMIHHEVLSHTYLETDSRDQILRFLRFQPKVPVDLPFDTKVATILTSCGDESTCFICGAGTKDATPTSCSGDTKPGEVGK